MWRPWKCVFKEAGLEALTVFSVINCKSALEVFMQSQEKTEVHYPGRDLCLVGVRCGANSHALG